MADATPGSPGFWLKTLGAHLTARAPIITRLDDYYRGEHPLAFAGQKFREAFGGLFDEFADNFCGLVVDAVEERLNVEGFRFSAGEDAKADADAWDIWQANGLDADSQLAHLEALITGESYALVWPDPNDDAKPRITIEHPSQTIVAPALSNHRARAAALKRYIDEDGYEVAYLYTPETVFRFRSRTRNRQGALHATPSWVPEDRPNVDPAEVTNGFGVVPVIPLVNRPRLLGSRYRHRLLGLGESEIRTVVPVQDAINKLVADLMVASEYGAFRQRWATGIEIPVDPVSKEPVEPFKAAVSRLWVGQPAEDSDIEPRFGEFEQTDLTNFVKAVEMLVQHVASQSRTPPHYFYLSGQFPSGESIKSAETGLVSKAQRKQRYFGEAWEDVLRLAFTVTGDTAKADFTAAETIWKDPESRTESEHVDAVQKKSALGVPQEQLWEDLGYSPTQISRFREMQQRQATLAAAAGLGLADLFKTDTAGRPSGNGTGDGGAPVDASAAT